MVAKNEIQKSVQTLAAFLEARKSSLAEVLPRHMTPERVIKVALSAASRNPRLLECSPSSLYLALHTSSQLGLEAGTPLGHAHLVPYRNGKTGQYECQFQPGYQGLIALSRRSGELATIYACAVRKGDTFKWTLGDEPRIIHVPADNPDRAEQPITHVYAVAKLKDGATQREVMLRSEVDAIMKRSKASGSGPWQTDYEAMAKKTVLKRICKLLPMSIELSTAIEHDSRIEGGEEMLDLKEATGEVVADPPAPEPSKTERIKAKLKERAEDQATADPETGELPPEGEDLSPPEGVDPENPPEDRLAALDQLVKAASAKNCTMANLREIVDAVKQLAETEEHAHALSECGARSEEELLQNPRFMRTYIKDVRIMAQGL